MDARTRQRLAERARSERLAQGALVNRYVEEGIRRDRHPRITFIPKISGRLPALVSRPRVLVTRDVGDLSRLELQFAAEEWSRQGIIFVSPRRFAASARAIGALVRALDAELQAHGRDDHLVDSRMWLGE